MRELAGPECLHVSGGEHQSDHCSHTHGMFHFATGLVVTAASALGILVYSKRVAHKPSALGASLVTGAFVTVACACGTMMRGKNAQAHTEDQRAE